MESSEPFDFTRTAALVRSAREGDQQALERLFRRYLPRVRQIVALRLGEPLRQFVEVDDVVQEVLLKAFRDLERFQQRSEGSFRNWLARCVECEIVDQARRAGAQKRGRGRVARFGDFRADFRLSTIVRGRGPSPSEVVQAAELEERVEEALLGLPEHYREVIVLRHLCEMSYAEIAESMGFAEEATARKACSRAIRKLEELVGPGFR